MFPGGGKKKFTMKKQFIVRMCDFEFELKFLHMHLIYQFLINDNISGVRSVDIVIKRLLVLYFCLIPCFLVSGMGTDFEKKTATCAVTRQISLQLHPT